VFVIVLGRAIRYFGEAYLGVQLGEGSAQFLRAHTWHLVLGAVALFGLLYVLLMLTERRRMRAITPRGARPLDPGARHDAREDRPRFQ
jgi:uncharacterized membrane protein YgdD (TMEM256/DUF423 family)